MRMYDVFGTMSTYLQCYRGTESGLGSWGGFVDMEQSPIPPIELGIFGHKWIFRGYSSWRILRLLAMRQLLVQYMLWCS